jgi:hypothetical protein
LDAQHRRIAQFALEHGVPTMFYNLYSALLV